MQSTETLDHWVLDHEFSIKNNHKDDNRLIIDYLESQIKLEVNDPYQVSNKTSSVEKKNTETYKVPKLFTEPLPRGMNYMTRSQTWVGYIEEIKNEEFVAKLIDINDLTTYEIAAFDNSDVSKGDEELFKLGATFYWSVTFANFKGQRVKQSLIRFKRSVFIDENDFEEIMLDVDKLSKGLTWD